MDDLIFNVLNLLLNALETKRSRVFKHILDHLRHTPNNYTAKRMSVRYCKKKKKRIVYRRLVKEIRSVNNKVKKKKIARIFINFYNILYAF